MGKDNVLFLRRDEQRKSDKHPEFRGSGVVFGEDVWVSAYVNTGDDGKKYFKISVTPKNESVTRSPPKSRQPVEDEFDDGGELPF